MKKVNILTLIFILNGFILFGQNFPEDNPELLLNKTVKPKEINESLQRFAYKNFFLEFDKEKKQFTKDEKKNKPFPTGSSFSPVSDYSKLVGKEFKVVEIYEITPKYSSSRKEYAVELSNPEIGTLFYKYDPRYEHSFELEVVDGLDFPEGFFCSKIQSKSDKFDDKETFYSPYENGISFVKVRTKGKSTIYLSVRVNGKTPNVNKKGLDLLFEDGTKLSKADAPIDVKVSSRSGYVYSAFIELSSSDKKLLSEKNITDKRLYIYEDTVDQDSAQKIRHYLKCLIE